MLIIEIFLAILLLLNPITLDTPTIKIQETLIINDTHTHLNTTPDPMPISNYIRPYNMTKTGGMWRAIDGSSYIIPNNEVVQWYANNTFLNETGLYYLNGKMVLPKYYPDFAYENEDYWINADYYLSHNLTGDCEDFALAIASILEAKNISNMFVAVTDRKNYRHFYLQYHFNNTYYTADFTHPRYQLRENNSKNKLQKVWMFNKTTPYTSYQENWINTQ